MSEYYDQTGMMRLLEERILNGQLGRIAVKALGPREGLRFQLAWETGWSFAFRAANAGLAFFTTLLLACLLGRASEICFFAQGSLQCELSMRMWLRRSIDRAEGMAAHGVRGNIIMAIRNAVWYLAPVQLIRGYQ